MSTHYRQLTLAQRYQIWSLRDTGYKLRAIGEKVGVDFSTVSRELRRNRSINGYKPQLAHKKSIDRKTTAKKSNKHTDKLKSVIEKGLCLGWSPDAINQRMKLEKIPESERLSHASIYRYIEKDKQQGGQLYRQLPRFGKTRWQGGKRNRHAGSKLIPGRIDIADRPAIVDARSRLGDWEGDTVHGKSAHLVTLVERKSRFTLAKRVTSKCKKEVVIHSLSCWVK